MAKVIRKCRKCRSDVTVINGKGKCWNCGREYKYIPERTQFIRTNMVEITADYIKLGALATCAKWDIGTNSLYKIPAIRKLVEKRRELGKRFWWLPKLPEFDNRWSDEVKVEWLKNYHSILTGVVSDIEAI